MRIQDVHLRKIFDSRGEPTIAVDVIDGRRRRFSASVPSGKSRGSREAAVFPFGKAARALAKAARAIVGKNFASVRALDAALLRADGTSNKSKLGGNLLLGISMAGARALADERREEAWQTLRREFFPRAEMKQPLIFSNLVNGGVHASSNMDIQEYMVVARHRGPVAHTIKTLIGFYRKLGEVLKARSKLAALPIGDEGGYALWFRNNFEPVRILGNLIVRMKLRKLFSVGLDAAATSFYRGGAYRFDGARISPDGLRATYLRYAKRSRMLFSIEDPFEENDAWSFAALRRRLRDTWIIGDDLTATSPALIKTYAKVKAINAVIVKPNQIGTVSEACDALTAARRCGVKAIVSHRSGETEDAFIMHLAKAAGADGVKIGAPTKERIAKFNELARLYDG